ncbi:MAG: alpha/beta hydrolase [Spirochaetes bacterium]|nr:alpha/beta hydrolase [Spirochaetota bacterium]
MTTIQEIPLWPGLPADEDIGEDRGTVHADRFLRTIGHPTVGVHLPSAPNGTAIVICPGGGYGGVCIDKEGHDIARRLASWGVASLVLKYRLPGGVYVEPPLPLADAWRALRLAASRAPAWGIDPARLGIMGFSAGGHLALTAGLNPDGARQGGDAVDRLEARARFMVLGYPVVNLLPPLSHSGSARALLGAEPSRELLERYSGDLRANESSPPTFLVHSEDDQGVPIANSVALRDALHKRGVDAELLRHPTGGHGYGMGAGAGFMAAPDWMPALKGWMDARGLLKAPGNR